ncbi:COP9 signalosome (CSN) subunit [Batrachochytrium dendrobatidis]|nr:COP9 signalosome (CSN) subunit [Batrachochytrium dendrobatidis]
MTPQSPVLQSYIAKLENCIAKENGVLLAEIISISTDHAATMSSILHLPEFRISSAISKLTMPWKDMAHFHVDVLRALERNDLTEAATLQNKLCLSFYQIFPHHTSWSLPVLYVLIRDLRSLSIRADAVLENGKKASHLEEAARTINRAFSACVTDRSSQTNVSRKWGTYFVVNMLFRTYFKLNSTNLCSTILRSLQSADLPNLSQFPISHQVTFKYYTGILAFYSENFESASSSLMFAFDRSLYQTLVDKLNKQSILAYLVPAQLMRGILPHPRLFTKYPAIGNIYQEFVHAVRSGNVKRFDDAFQIHEAELIRRGTWLTIELVRLLVLRTLFRNVWLIHAKASRIHMSVFQRALELASGDQPVDSAQVECFLAIMVDKNFIKGYLSHERQMVVLSNKDPFPSMKSAMVQ